MTIDPGALDTLLPLISGAKDGHDLLWKFAMMRGLIGARAVVRNLVTGKPVHQAWWEPGSLAKMGAWRSRFQGHCFCADVRSYWYVVVREHNPLALVRITAAHDGSSADVWIAAEESEAEEIAQQLVADLAEGPLEEAA